MLAKDQFVRGLQADMHMTLKPMKNFKDCDITTLAEHTVSLEIAGIKSSYNECSPDGLDSVNTTEISRPDHVLNLIVVKFADKLVNQTLYQEARGNAKSERNRKSPL